MKVALVAPGWERGGGVPAVADFLHRALLASGRYDVSLISLATSWRDPESTRLSRPWEWFARPRTSLVGLSENRTAVRMGARFAEWEMQRYAPRAELNRAMTECDIVQVVCGSAIWAHACLDVTRPVFVQVATTLEVERKGRGRRTGMAGALQRFATRRAAQIEARALQRAKAVFVENQWMAEHVAKLRGPQGVVFAPPGIDTDFFCPDENVPRTHVLFVGRIDDPRKNVELLLEAYARCLPRLGSQPPPLVLAGHAGPTAKMTRLIENLGISHLVQIRLRVTAPELRQLYRSARVFTLPSNEEGLGVVLIEALACGTPVVSTDCGGPSTVVEHGKNGLLVPIRNVEAFAVALERMLRDLSTAERMGEAGRLRMTESHSLVAAGGRFIAAYQQLGGAQNTGAIR